MCCQCHSSAKGSRLSDSHIFQKLLSGQKFKRRASKYFLTMYAMNKLCTMRQYSKTTTVEVVYFHPSPCHHSSSLLPANTMTLFLRQLGNVLVITPKTMSLPKHCALRLGISHLSSDHRETQEENKLRGYF